MALPNVAAAQPAEEESVLPFGVRVLTPVDRCDASNCGSQARAVIVLTNGSELLFCRHHTEAYRVNLEEQGSSIYTQYQGL